MFERSILDNGLRVLTYSMPHALSVTVAVLVGGGSRHESQEQCGAFHFIEHLLFKGTQRRPTAQEISETIEGVGGVMNGSTDRELSAYWCKVPHPHFAMSLDRLADQLCNSLFDPQDMVHERGDILE